VDTFVAFEEKNYERDFNNMNTVGLQGAVFVTDKDMEQIKKPDWRNSPKEFTRC
jgi:hypothetical protein